MTTTGSGLQYEDLVEGTGTMAKSGDSVDVHYTGWLTDGTKFDSSHDRKKPFSFTLDKGESSRAGTRASHATTGSDKLTIPPELGYGTRGAGGVIPQPTLSSRSSTTHTLNTHTWHTHTHT